MNKNNVFGVGILIIILMIVGGLIFKVFVLDKDKNDDGIVQEEKKKKEYKLKEDGFEFEAEYEGNNRWEYEIKGHKPSPCHEIKHEAMVQESHPEQVTVNLSISSPSPDTNCIQVIEELNIEGTFMASPEAKVSFAVKTE